MSLYSLGWGKAPAQSAWAKGSWTVVKMGCRRWAVYHAGFDGDADALGALAIYGSLHEAVIAIEGGEVPLLERRSREEVG